MLGGGKVLVKKSPYIGDRVRILKTHQSTARGKEGQVLSKAPGGRLRVRLGPSYYAYVLPENLEVIG